MKMNVFLRLALIGVLLAFSLPAVAAYYDFASGDFFFKITEENTAKLVRPVQLQSLSGEVVIPQSVTNPNDGQDYVVTHIGNYAFDQCAEIVTVDIPSTVVSIGGRAFRDCAKLQSCEIPLSVKVLGPCAFQRCSSLASCGLQRGCGITELSDGVFEGCTSLVDVTIPESVTAIHWDAFSGCTALTSVAIPRNVKCIMTSAFEGCTSLTSIEIPVAVRALDYRSFAGCTSLREIISLPLLPPAAVERSEYNEFDEWEVFSTFDGVDKDNCVIRVYESVMDDYRQAEGWSEFRNYEALNEIEYPEGDINGDGVVDIADINGVVNSMLDFSRVVVMAAGQTQDMTPVEGGTFMMGSDNYDEQYLDIFGLFPCNPVHEVTLDSYLISTTEVTQRFYNAVMGLDAPAMADANLPAYGLSWDDCQAFIRRLNEVTGLKFRLPTEAEWEFAARGGNKSKGYRYSGSDDYWEAGYCTDQQNFDYDTAIPHPVAGRKPNELGIYDMSGNVFEWCQDWYGEYPASPQVNPTGPEAGTQRILRGGSCDEVDGECCRVYDRSAAKPSSKTSFGESEYGEPLGMRLVIDRADKLYKLYNRSCDVNGDGCVDIGDMNVIINAMLSKSTVR